MRSRHGPTLAERSGVVSPADAGTGARHCWVADAPGHPGEHPGLLAEWRRTPSGWEGRVVYALPERGGGSRLVERWVEAGHLRAT